MNEECTILQRGGHSIVGMGLAMGWTIWIQTLMARNSLFSIPTWLAQGPILSPIQRVPDFFPGDKAAGA
jgi:hypothetical protein